MRPTTRRFLIALVVLLVIDGTLTGYHYAIGAIHAGKAPILEAWDVVKVFATATMLAHTATLTGARGLGMLGVIFAVIGLIDATEFHAYLGKLLARALPLTEIFGIHPLTEPGLGEDISLAVIGGLLLVGLFVFRDRTPEGRSARRVLVPLLALLMVFAGGFDIVDDYFGVGTVWSTVEEIGERVVITAAAAYAYAVWVGTREARAPTGPVS